MNEITVQFLVAPCRHLIRRERVDRALVDGDMGRSAPVSCEAEGCESAWAFSRTRDGWDAEELVPGITVLDG